MRSRLVPLGFLTTLASCGGGGGGDTVIPPPVTITILGLPAGDGGSSSAGNFFMGGGGPIAGDLDASNSGVGWRQFFSFDLAAIPAGAAVTAAELQLDQIVVVGTAYPGHGVITVDHVFFDTLDANDYGAPALQADVGTLSSDGTLGVKLLTVTGNVQADRIAGRTVSQYRVHFSLFDSDGDAIDEYVAFADAENSNGAGQIPRLVVTYQP